jgi:mono/diheme cytochrome c family protein
MLTPGNWIVTQNFWEGLFNPTYIVSVVIRTAVAVILAGLYGLLTSTFIKDDDETRKTMIRYNAGWALSGFIVLPFAGAWYISMIPPLSRFISMGGAAAVTLFATATIFISALLVIFLWISPFKRSREFTTTFAVMFMILGFAVTGVTEWTREAVRKPYIIYDYMYSNGIKPENGDTLNKEGVLKHYKWSTIDVITPENRMEAGRQMFRAQCEHCHVTDGYNAVTPLVYGWDKQYTLDQIERLHILKPFMPPVFGTQLEKEALAEWLSSLNEGAEQEVAK